MKLYSILIVTSGKSSFSCCTSLIQISLPLSVTSFKTFCGSLINDQLFIRNFSSICYHILETSIFKDVENVINHGGEKISYNIWNEFWFHSFNKGVIDYNIIQKKFQWIDFFSNNLAYLKEFLSYVGTNSFKELPNIYLFLFHAYKATAIQPNEETQLFFDKIVEKILCNRCIKNENNGIIVTSFKEDNEILSNTPVYYFIEAFYQVFRSFIDKPNLKFDKLFDVLSSIR